MDKTEFRLHMDLLNLDQPSLARLIGVSPRTVRRWTDDPTEIPKPAEQAIRAWAALHKRGLPWRPDAISVTPDDPDSLARYVQHTMDLAAILDRVAARGGPLTPWQVNLSRCCAVLGTMEVSFYRLPDGGFSPQSYRRTDVTPDIQRDQPLLEDAFACIAAAIAKQLGTASREILDLGPPQLNEDRVIQWSINEHPPVAVVVTCDTLRKAIKLPVTDEDARQLLVMPANREILANAAMRKMILHKIGPIGSPPIKVIQLELNDLLEIGTEFKPAALQARWIQ